MTSKHPPQLTSAEQDEWKRVMLPAMVFANAEYNICPGVGTVEALGNTTMIEKKRMQTTLFDHPELLGRMLDTYPDRFPRALKKIVLEWAKLLVKMPKAIIVRFTPNGALTVDAANNRVYLVRGIVDSCEAMMKAYGVTLPCGLELYLLPWRDSIIWDGLIGRGIAPIDAKSEYAKRLNAICDDAIKSKSVITQLTQEVVAAVPKNDKLGRQDPNAGFYAMYSLWRPDPLCRDGVKHAMMLYLPRQPQEHCLCGSINTTFEGCCQLKKTWAHIVPNIPKQHSGLNQKTYQPTYCTMEHQRVKWTRLRNIDKIYEKLNSSEQFHQIVDKEKGVSQWLFFGVPALAYPDPNIPDRVMQVNFSDIKLDHTKKYLKVRAMSYLRLETMAEILHDMVPGELKAPRKKFWPVERYDKNSSVIMSMKPSERTQLCPICEHCGVVKLQLKQCSGCHIARYCSPECQKSDWIEHKLECPRLKSEYDASLAEAAEEQKQRAAQHSAAAAAKKEEEYDLFGNENEMMKID